MEYFGLSANFNESWRDLAIAIGNVSGFCSCMVEHITAELWKSKTLKEEHNLTIISMQP